MAQPEFFKLKNDVDKIATSLLRFNVEFYDEAKFKYFVDNHMVNLFHSYDEICISGHFSEGLAELICSKLEGVRKNLTLRILTSSTGTSSIEALRKIQDAGAKIRYNRRTHFRMFVGKSESQGYLILGSFDFNKEGMTMDRRNAGISTTHPDLVQSAYKYFMKVWQEERDSIPLDEKFPDERKRISYDETGVTAGHLAYHPRARDKKILLPDDIDSQIIGQAPHSPWEVVNPKDSGIEVTDILDEVKTGQKMMRVYNDNTRGSIERKFEESEHILLEYDLWHSRYWRRSLGSPFIIQSSQHVGAPNGFRPVYMEISNKWLVHGFPEEKIIEIKEKMWYHISVEVNCTDHYYIVSVNNEVKMKRPLHEGFTSVNSIRTKNFANQQVTWETYLKAIKVTQLGAHR